MKIKSAALARDTLAATLIEFDVTAEKGTPNFVIVGTPPAHARETSVRVRSAAQVSERKPPAGRIVMTAHPADVSFEPQTLVGLDLAFALGYLGVSVPGDTYVFGELSLQGNLRHIRGALPLAIAARDAGARTVIVPADCAAEVALIPDVDIVAARTLGDVVDYLSGKAGGAWAVGHTPATELPPPSYYDMADVRGQAGAIRAMTVAAMLRRNILFVGPPGCGKTLLAARGPGILPPLAAVDARTIACNLSALGLTEPFVAPAVKRPFRAPHHSISAKGLQGEAKLAEFGVLFLDDLPEFSRHVLGTAKPSPLNWVVASANPCLRGCPRECVCSPLDRERYAQRVCDNVRTLGHGWLFCRVNPIPTGDYNTTAPGPTTQSVREQVRGGYFHAGPNIAKALAWLDGDIQDYTNVKYAREAQALQAFPF